MKKKTFIDKYRTIIIILTMFLLWLSFVIFVVVPAQKSLRESFVLVEKKKIENSVNEDKIKRMPALEENYDLVEGNFENLDVIFSKDKIVDLVNEIEGLADRTGNKIKISVGDEKKIVDSSKNNKKKDVDNWEGFLNDLPSKNFFVMEIVLSGDYASLINFMDKLNNIKYYNVIKEFSVNKKIEKNEENRSNRSVDSGQISLLSSGDGDADILIEEVSGERKFLETNLVVLFYTLEENKNENK